MRAGLLLIVVSGLGCRPAPHIDLSLGMNQCASFEGNPQLPRSCSEMTLDCANFIEARIYESDASGSLGRILGSNCLSAAALGQPADLCALQHGHSPFALLGDLPDGKTVRFRLRALRVSDEANGCNDDLPGAPAPNLVFDGFSPPVHLDGNDHRVVIELGVCASCGVFGTTGTGCELPNPPPVCLTPEDRCPDGAPALYVPAGCCGVCTPT